MWTKKWGIRKGGREKEEEEKKKEEDEEAGRRKRGGKQEPRQEWDAIIRGSFEATLPWEARGKAA